MKSVAAFTWEAFLSVPGAEPASHPCGFDTLHLDTDTRTLDATCAFMPLVGETFNGNDFIEKAYVQGARAAFVEAAYLKQHADLQRFPNLIAVEDAGVAFLALANRHRRRMPAKIVAITGSSGKTTVKEMLFAFLAAALGESCVQKTYKNYNNEVGVPLTLLDLKPETQVMVVEMAMRGLRQIAPLSLCAEPDIAVITNIGPAHIGLLGSLENIAKAKCEIFEGLSPETGLAVINGDDPLLIKEVPQVWPHPMEIFSLHDVENIHTLPGGAVTFDYQGVTFHLGVPGSHNVMNAMAGIKVCEALGLPLKKMATALQDFQAGDGRWEKTPVPGSRNLWIINDAYNANPTSMKMALSALMASRMEGLRKVAVLGGMAELGSHSEFYHYDIGDWLSNQTGLAGVIAVGEAAKPMMTALPAENFHKFWVASVEEVVPLIQELWPQDAVFFLKASRAFHLERLSLLLETALAAASSEAHAAS